MGYSLHITRADDWAHSKSQPILEAEWLAIVNADSSLQISTTDYYDRRTETGEVKRIHPVLWIGHSDNVPFWFDDGAIEVSSPDDAVIAKMKEIATKLNARVVGDDGEEY